MQQVIGLTGFNGKEFAKFALNVRFAHLKFARHFPEGSMEDWKAAWLDDTYLRVDAANRYFTPTKDAPPAAARLVFDEKQDPENRLNDALKSGDVVRLRDNEVLFFEAYVKEGKTR